MAFSPPAPVPERAAAAAAGRRALAAGLLAGFSCGLAFPASALDVAEAERTVRAACKADPQTVDAECDCYMRALEELLPGDTYGLMIGLAAAGMTGDIALMQEVLDEGDISAEAFGRMQMDLQSAMTAAERRCEPEPQ